MSYFCMTNLCEIRFCNFFRMSSDEEEDSATFEILFKRYKSILTAELTDTLSQFFSLEESFLRNPLGPVKKHKVAPHSHLAEGYDKISGSVMSTAFCHNMFKSNADSRQKRFNYHVKELGNYFMDQGLSQHADALADLTKNYANLTFHHSVPNKDTLGAISN